LKLVVRFVILSLLADNSVIMFRSGPAPFDVMHMIVEAMMMISEIAVRDRPSKTKKGAVDEQQRQRLEQNSFPILHSIVLQDLFFVDLDPPSLPEIVCFTPSLSLFVSLRLSSGRNDSSVLLSLSAFFQHAKDVRQAQRLLMLTDRAIEWINWTRTRLEVRPLSPRPFEHDHREDL